MSNVKYPHITVSLHGQDGKAFNPFNAYNLVSLIKKALQHNKIPEEEIDAFLEEALSGDDAHVLRTCLQTVNFD